MKFFLLFSALSQIIILIFVHRLMVLIAELRSFLCLSYIEVALY